MKNIDNKQNEHGYLRDVAMDALRQAAKEAWELSLRTHTPFIVYRDGKVVDLNAPATSKPAKS